MLVVFIVSSEIFGVCIVANKLVFFEIARTLLRNFRWNTDIPFLHLCSNYLLTVPVPGQSFRVSGVFFV